MASHADERSGGENKSVSSSKANGFSAVNVTDDSQDYFKSYTDPHVHEIMLRDWPRMAAYRRFFEDNPNLIKDKLVMDVGSGTGILSLFAASVGARKVFAVEASNTASLCKEIVEQNGFTDRIEVIQAQVEDLDLDNDVKVDVIVSEWMGFYLLHESMLDSVIAARDKFLTENGIMVPARARLHIAPVNMETFLEEKFEFWTNVCGFDFSAAIPHVRQRLMQEPLTTELKMDQVVATPHCIADFDLKTVTLSDVQTLRKLSNFQSEKDSTIHGFALWFDVDFQQNTDCSTTEESDKMGHRNQSENVLDKVTSSPPVDWKVIPLSMLSTSPAGHVTHWKQTVILLPRSLVVNKGDTVGFQVDLAQDPVNKRHYNITLELVDVNSESEGSEIESDQEDHPTPCECESAKCRLIKALMDKYNEEQDALEAEAEMIDLTAEVEAARTVGEAMKENVSSDDSH